ncbi:MAG: elongation factor G-like protein [Frankiales bacterium]|nr:elongation factor G-like protein [Frankiales bacterium]
MTRSPSPARLVAVLGHEGSGKTTLVRALGGPSTASGVVLLEGRAALPLADGVVFVLSSAQGMDPTLPLRWEEAADAGLPRVLCVTQLDLPRADFDESVAVLQRVLGEGVHPLALPVLDDDEQVTGVLRLLDLQLLVDGTVRDAEPEHVGLVEGLHDDLLEALLSGSSDDAVFDAWLGGEVPATDVLRRELAEGVAGGTLHPVLPVTASGVGGDALLDLLLASVPAAGEVLAAPVHDVGGAVVELSPDPDGPLAARVSGGLVRVLSGTLHDGAAVSVDGVVSALALRDLDGTPLSTCPPGRVARADALPDGLLSSPDRPLTD